MSSLEIVRLMNREDATVAAAVGRALPQIARAIDVVVAGVRHGGRLIYIGAGTSGRIGALDASEIPPTFNTDPRTVQFLMAGGPNARAETPVESSDVCDVSGCPEGGRSGQSDPQRFENGRAPLSEFFRLLRQLP